MSKPSRFDVKSLTEYRDLYSKQMANLLNGVDNLSEACHLLKEAQVHKRRVFVAGNGGSAAIANHFCTDMSKLAKLSCVSLCTNTPVILMIGNDESFDDIFSSQLHYHHLNHEDLVVLISSSGRSRNILQAANVAKSRSSQILSFTGFNGGSLKPMATVDLNIPIDNYGVVEDSHQALMHIMAQWLSK